MLALVLGLIISAGLYFAYLWPSVEPSEPDDAAGEADAGTRPGADTGALGGDGAASPAP